MIYLIKPENGIKNRRLDRVTEEVLKDISYKKITCVEEMKDTDLTCKKILFAIGLGEAGINMEYIKILEYMRLNKKSLASAVAGVIVDGTTEFYTKNIARELVFSANMSGCAFPGRPLVEATGKLKNFNLQAKLNNIKNEEAYVVACKELIERINIEYTVDTDRKKRRKILALHSSNFKTSNTLLLWDMIKKQLDEFEIEEISLENGTLTDCRGCPHSTCMHFSEMQSCYYGGKVVEEIYPAILDCDALVMICPNYNDAVGANITAFINRLTALFKTNKFYDKKLFAVIVSGYSGSDIVAQQLVSAVNMNKTFALPPYFAICETANNAREILSCEGIVEKTRIFAENIKLSFK